MTLLLYILRHPIETLRILYEERETLILYLRDCLDSIEDLPCPEERRSEFLAAFKQIHGLQCTDEYLEYYFAAKAYELYVQREGES